jgi:hypothetical protein
LEQLGKAREELQATLEAAQEWQKRFYDRHVREQPSYEVGDKVWLDSSNLSTDRPMKKLDFRRIGPYKVEKKVSATAYRLSLPQTLRVHPVFHVSLLSPFRAATVEGQTQAPPPKVVVPVGEEWKVRRILNARWVGDELQYLVRWQGRPAEEDNWESRDRLEEWEGNVAKMEEFHLREPLAWSLTRRPPPRSSRRRSS